MQVLQVRQNEVLEAMLAMQNVREFSRLPFDWLTGDYLEYYAQCAKLRRTTFSTARCTKLTKVDTPNGTYTSPIVAYYVFRYRR